MRTVLCALALASFAPPAAALERLVTATYEITINVLCEEGVVGCNNVRLTAVERKTGNLLRLKGDEMHTRCADGVTPCRFLGYVFRSGSRTYHLWENGTFVVRRNGKVVLEEKGTLEASAEQSAQHGRWRAYTENEGRLCKAETVGGSGRRLVVQVEAGGGNAWFYVEAPGAMLPLGKDDEPLLRIDGRRPKVYDYDVSMAEDKDDAGAPRKRVAMPNGYTPEFIRGMRAAPSVALLRAGARQPEVLQRFSMSGFPAGLRQIAAWCKFNPDQLFQP